MAQVNRENAPGKRGKRGDKDNLGTRSLLGIQGGVKRTLEGGEDGNKN